jgi:hypothetical protein
MGVVADGDGEDRGSSGVGGIGTYSTAESMAAYGRQAMGPYLPTGWELLLPPPRPPCGIIGLDPVLLRSGCGIQA